MLFALALLTEVTLRPTDDVWVYPHAGDPAKDAYLRVWGREGVAVAKTVGDSEELSYSLMRFDPAGLPEGKPTKAVLILTTTAGPNYSADYAKAHPLQARPVDGGFSEKGWKYDLLERFLPAFDPKSVYGTGVPAFPKADAEGTVEIDLLKGPGDFRAILKEKKPFGIALTSTLDVQANPDVQTIYKFYSKDAPVEASRPGWSCRSSDPGAARYNRPMPNENYQSASEMVRSLEKIRVPYELLDTHGPFRLLKFAPPYWDGYEFWLVNEKGFMWEPAESEGDLWKYLESDEAQSYIAALP